MNKKEEECLTAASFFPPTSELAPNSAATCDKIVASAVDPSVEDPGTVVVESDEEEVRTQHSSPPSPLAVVDKVNCGVFVPAVAPAGAEVAEPFRLVLD